MSTPLEDYALIGDCETAALVSRAGSIDWLCWPRFDSPACFAALLGRPEHGHWRISPTQKFAARRRYRPDTLILETDFENDEGAVTLIDFMPVVGRRGRVAMEMEGVLRFDYGASVPWVSYFPDRRGLRAIAGPDMVVLYSPVPLANRHRTTCASFEVGAGETLSFVLAHGASYREPPPAIDAGEALAATERFWREWIERCAVCNGLEEPVRRSLITLKALTYAPTGGIVAAPTTSLPER